MDGPTLLITAGVAAALAIAAVAASRGARRERWLAPARLGPTWQPSVPDDASDLRVADPEARDVRAEAVQQRTGLDRATVDTVLIAWDEYRAVLGLVVLPPSHRYRVYDPYVPPVAEQGPSGPILDTTRVARDVARRTPIAQTEATKVLEALSEVSEGGASGAEAS